MSKSEHVRKDKTCLNCRYVVENKFCPNCGQKNEDTRKSFHHLFVHFFEDLTHYEGAFWRTIKNLLFKPASLTTEYLSGKRLSYLAPIRLYLFISFVTFLTISSLRKNENGLIKVENKSKNEKNTTKETKNSLIYIDPEIDIESEKDTISKEVKKIIALEKEGKLSKKESDTLIQYTLESEKKQDRTFYYGKKNYKSIKQLDSIQNAKNSQNKLGNLEYWLIKKMITVGKKHKDVELIKKFEESFYSNFPKVLFIYMPIFGSILWLFHSKKRWYYFDHGIFTLHYFSFLLLLTLIYSIVESFLILIFGTNGYTENVSELLSFVFFLWSIIYFFKAHYKFYLESKKISFIKSFFMLFINLFFIISILVIFIIFTFINLH